MQRGYDVLLKLLMIGDSGVGKSCLLLRFCDESFTQSFITTIGIDFKIKSMDIDGQRVKLQIWDTAGQERFRTITTGGAMGILLIYDISDEQSFLNIRNWMRNIEQHASKTIQLLLVGNKCDLTESRLISTKRGQELADEYGLSFFEASAKSDTNVKESFIQIVKDILIKNQMENRKSMDARVMEEKSKKPKGKKCSCIIL